MNKDVKEGTKVTFDATIKGTPKPEITWYKEEIKLEPTDRIKIDSKEVGVKFEKYIVTILSYASVSTDDLLP